MSKTLIVIPTYNEAENISELIKSVLRVDSSFHILFVDDSSPDGTGSIIDMFSQENQSIHLISRPGKLGLGTAYIEGFKWALARNYEFVVQMDADLSHNPKDINRLISEMDSSDVAIGSRYIDGFNVVNWPLSRLALSYGANIYAKLLIGFPIYDSTAGFKCFKSDVLREIDLNAIKSEGYSFQIEMNYFAFINNFKIKEVSIVFTDRTIGQSKMSKRIIIEAIFMVPRLMFRKIFLSK